MIYRIDYGFKITSVLSIPFNKSKSPGIYDEIHCFYCNNGENSTKSRSDSIDSSNGKTMVFGEPWTKCHRYDNGNGQKQNLKRNMDEVP